MPIADELKGALPAAFVRGRAGPVPHRGRAEGWALEGGPAYAHPRRVWFVDEFPLASTNKIDKTALAAEAGRRWAPRPA